MELPRSRVFMYMRNAATAIASIFAVLFMIAYMLIDAERLRNLFLLVYPPEVRGETPSAAAAESDWRRQLEREVASRLARGETGIADSLTRDFETALIAKALQHTGGRRIEAATLLGIGRNTLTRKVQDLKIDTKD